MKTLFGLFDDNKTAKQAVEVLEKAGLGAKHVTLLTKTDKADLDALKKSMNDSDVDFYVDSVVKDGASLLVIDSDDAHLGKVAGILHKLGSVDVESRAKSHAEAHGKKEVLREAKESDYVMPVIEESLEVGKREVERGKVRVYNRITEKQVEEKVGLRDETIHVQRRAVDRPVKPGEDLFKERSFEVREVDEEAVVSKVARIVEEVVVSKETVEKIQTIKDTVRRSDVEIEEIKAHRGFTEYDKDFRGFFDKELIKSGHKYDDYLPAFKFGHSLATSEHTHKHGWAELEAGARRRGKRRTPVPGPRSRTPSTTRSRRPTPERRCVALLPRGPENSRRWHLAAARDLLTPGPADTKIGPRRMNRESDAAFCFSGALLDQPRTARNQGCEIMNIISEDGRKGRVARRITRKGQPDQLQIEFDDGSRLSTTEDQLELRQDGTAVLLRKSDHLTELTLKAVDLAAGEELVIPVGIEELHVAKRKVVRGVVHVRTRVQTREQVVDEPLLHEEVTVERIAIDKEIRGEIPQATEKNGVLIIPVIEEVLVITKQLRLKEEIRVIRKSTKVRKPEKFELRREHIEIERREDGTVMDETDSQIVTASPEHQPTTTQATAPVPKSPAAKTEVETHPKKSSTKATKASPSAKKTVKPPAPKKKPR